MRSTGVPNNVSNGSRPISVPGIYSSEPAYIIPRSRTWKPELNPVIVNVMIYICCVFPTNVKMSAVEKVCITDVPDWIQRDQTYPNSQCSFSIIH